MIKPHAKMCKADREYLEAMQLERVAQDAFCHIKERLYENNTHRWEDLLEECSGELDDPFLIWTGKGKGKEVICHYTTHPLDRVNKISQNKVGLLLQVTLHFPGTATPPFGRTIYLEQWTL